MHASQFIRVLILTPIIVVSVWTVPGEAVAQDQDRFEIPGTGFVVNFSDRRDIGEVPEPTLVSALIQWIVGVADLPAPITQPRFRHLPPSAMVELIAGNILGPAEYRNPPMNDVVAFYDRPEGAIVLPEGWHASRVGVSVLVHELVHHIQADADLKYACPAASEAVAYDVQEIWLGLFDMTLEQAFQIDRLTRFVLTVCGF